MGVALRRRPQGSGVSTPGVVYAADPKDNSPFADPDHAPSRRPFETAEPLAARLDQQPVTKFRQGQEADLAAEVVELSGVVLICWEHKRTISDLLPAITGPHPDLPTHWPGDRFDVVVRLDRAAPESAWQVTQLRPMLLAGDRDAPLGE